MKEYLDQMKETKEGKLLEEIRGILDQKWQAWYYGVLNGHKFFGVSDKYFWVGFFNTERFDLDNATYMLIVRKDYEDVKLQPNKVERNIFEELMKTQEDPVSDDIKYSIIPPEPVVKTLQKLKKLNKAFSNLDKFYFIFLPGTTILISKELHMIMGELHRIVIMGAHYIPDRLEPRLENLYSCLIKK